MSEKRRDKKGRILHNGEIQMPDGRYRFKYLGPNGKEIAIYSWRLVSTDITPAGKKDSEPLRELEKQIQKDIFDNIDTRASNITVLQLVKKYIATKKGVRRNTQNGYHTVLTLLENDSFGRKIIANVKKSDAKTWLIKLQEDDGRSYNSVRVVGGVLRPAFQLAVDDDFIRKNPFSFSLKDVIVNESLKREALSEDDEKKFLEFIKVDGVYKKYYEVIYILFKTGMRISEFCGLTMDDINFDDHSINIDHQLLKTSKVGYYIEKTKTKNGTRVIPMTDDVEECFRTLIAKRKTPLKEPIVDGYSGFLFFNRERSITHAYLWNQYFKRIVEKYNRLNKDSQIPKVTPHICRHTYCSNMAKSGINPKALQYLMGHSSISVTLNIYTHLNYNDIKEEVHRINNA
ncbi:tyrosine-type recombinase/integrase [Anaerovibrio lipolyticus]|uniref:tyrosine-type recombinase/integrase n=1 Tax=Anaerovibrio lipolyticus TaxID=82374 RepID=UPI00048218E3|nr:tyrosine-type recombinase/integrase [Anaerovibrio lipolyticus]